MQKLYCYVDETGQETKGTVFIVSIVVLDKERDQILKLCEQLEIISGKRKDKWGSAKHDRRMRYLRHILADDRLKGKLRFSVSRHTREYDVSTLNGIAKAVLWDKPKNFTSVIYVDGLSKTKRRQYAIGLRRCGLPIRKVMGVARDESNALTRLADAIIAGFVNDALKGNSKEINALYERAKREGILIQV